MNIPYSILEGKTFISKSCYDYHQSLAKKYYTLYKKNKSSNQAKSNKNIKKKIFNWFFTLDIKEKIKICSIYNNWFIRILDQLLTYNFYDNSMRFKPKEIYGNFYKMLNNNFEEENFKYKDYLETLAGNNENNPEKYFNTYFSTNECDSDFTETNKNLYVEREFLKELRFFSLNEYNDILSLNEELLNNKQKLQEYFDKFSDCNIFKENIIVIKAMSICNNIFNFTFPNWVRNMKKFSIQQLIIICFEISISIYYQIFLIEQSIPSFDIDSKIEDLFNMKMTMENYISKEVNKEQNKIISILDKKKIDIEISTDAYNKLFVDHENITDYVYKLAFDHNQSSFYTDPCIKDENINTVLNSLKKHLNNNIPQFVHDITFIKANKVFKIENIVYNIIYQKISTLCSERNLEEIYMDINETPTLKKKKKKNRKNKEKKEGNEIHENEEKKEENENNKDNKEKNNSAKNEINNFEENEIHNINDNKFSINADDNNKNNSNNSEDEEDEENQIFSNDYYNEIENSKDIKNINNDEESIKECIEMKLLDDKGKEIYEEEKKEKEEENKNETDLLEELLKENKQEKKINNNNNKKKKKRKNKKKKINQEENNIEINKKEELKEEPKIEEDNTDNKMTLNTPEISSNNNQKEIKEINTENTCHKKEENKNRKKQKDFFLYPVEKKKAKNINNNSNHKNSNKKNFSKNEDNNLSIKKESSKDNISETSATEKKEMTEKKETREKNEIININNEININNKDLDFSEINESKIVIVGNKNSANVIEKSNKIEHSHEQSKIQNINLNNSTINNYVIIDKYPPNKLLSFDNKEFQKNIYPQLISPYNYPMPFHQLPNYYLYERNDLFNDLTQEILSHEENITNNLSLLEKYRKEIYFKIKNFIENVLYKNNFDVKLIKYGSHETGLSIESSDIDILIKFCKNININNIGINNQQNIEEILALIYNELNNKKEKFYIIQINAIYTASVPVLKIKFNLENIIPKEIIKKIKENYIFNFDEDILELNFDFTFHEVEKIDDVIKIPSLEIISFIKKSLNFYKEIKPIILILKRFMKINKLNSSFHGGLSSYSLFLLLYSYIKYMFLQTNSLGHYLYGFFEFYSNFNFGIYYINPILDCPFMILDELHESGMMLIDPITSLNVAKSTFRIDQIKSVLTKGMVIIRNIFFTNKGKDYIHNLNCDKDIFLKELFKNQNGTMIVEKIFQQIHIQNQQVIGNWKNI